MNASLSTDAKDALAREMPSLDHCRSTLLEALVTYGAVKGRFHTQRNAVARLFWSLLPDRKAFVIESQPVKRLRGGVDYSIRIPAELLAPMRKPSRRCDRIMEARAAFLAIGSLAAESSGYHLELTPHDLALATRLASLLRALGYPPKRMKRKTRDVLYYKHSDTIVELLTLLGAHRTVLALEDIRAMRETKNRIHRLVNTEAANLDRSAGAAAIQRQLVLEISREHGLKALSPALREIAELRLKYPEAALAELGARCEPPISKPTVQSRFSALARHLGRLRGEAPAE
uniref:Cell division protein WhiA n=1 Tax=mine drainage metagenome TaxID=410659 RepID=E6PCN2_9ZZZZ